MGIQSTYYGNVKSAPVWAKDFISRDHMAVFPAKLDASQFTNKAGVTITTSASASAAAGTIAVTALTFPASASGTLASTGQTLIPVGATLDFGGAKLAIVTTAAVLGDTSIAVRALPTALASGDVATYSPYGQILIPGGTLVGRTYAERDANTGFGPAAVTDDEIYLTLWDIPNATENSDVELYRPGSMVAENYLPDYTTLNTAVNEVQTVNFNIASTGGNVVLRVPKVDGTLVQTTPAAWSATDATYLANINTVLDAATGVAGGIVASAISATDPDLGFKLTFSGTGYASLPAPAVVTVVTLPTSSTSANVVRTTTGGTPLLTLIRSKYRCITGKD